VFGESEDERKQFGPPDVLTAELELEGPWKLSFAKGWGAPESVELRELISWTEHEDKGVRYYSGIGRYEKVIDIRSEEIAEGWSIVLDLGDLWSVGEVFVNGKSAGIVWKPPYRVDIATLVKAGSNRLEIEIANTWANRLVGDALSPEGERYCRTNIARSGTPGKAWKDIELRKSGLFGPVRLIRSRFYGE
jgi:hypothetical protein